MSLEQAIEKNTAAIVANTIALQAFLEKADAADTPTLSQAEQEKAAEPPKAKEPTEAEKKAAAKKKAKADADKAIAKQAKKERDAKRQAEIDAETAEAAEQEVTETEVVDEPEATLEDCRVVATYIMKVKNDKAGLASTLEKLGTKNISGFEGDPADFLAALEETAGKTLAKIKG